MTRTATPPPPPRLVQRPGAELAHHVRPGTSVALCYQPLQRFGTWPAPAIGTPVCPHCTRRAQAQPATR